MKHFNKLVFALLLAFALFTLAGCSDRAEPGSSVPQASVIEPPPSSTEPSSETTSPSNSDTGVRAVNNPSELIGSPDRVILMVNEEETVFEPGSVEYGNALEILHGRMPEYFKEAASAFVWLDETQQNIDWTVMARDFDYVRLSYSDMQSITIHCMDEGYEDYTLSASYQDITFPLTDSEQSGSPAMCILGRNTFLGALDDTADVLSSLSDLSHN